ncbi:MAG: MerR family transcriptional regulator [Micromonosporaceae bacterium]
MTTQGWTLDELVAQVAARLGDGAAPVSRRVRQVPDRRAIRWYTTIGLLDRPVLRGRTGLYGRRHLLQLLAVKRLQAAGRTLAEIQAELTGATDAALRRVAGISAEELDATPRPDAGTPPDASQRRFWTTPPTAAPTVPADPAAPRASTAPTAPAAPASPAPAQAPASTAPAAPVAVRYVVELADGVTLLLDTPPDDLAAVRAAARPLLDHLAS